MAKSDTRKRFEQKFREELDAGNATFEFEGKQYSTKLAAPSAGGPTRRGRGSPTGQYDEAKPATSLKDFYEKYPDSFPKKYAPDDAMSSSGPQTEAQRTGAAIGNVRKAIRDAVSSPSEDADNTAKAAIKAARTANIQAGNRADEGILPGSTYSRSGYKKGGMVKAKKSGVRGAGCAAKGHGKMKMY